MNKEQLIEALKQLGRGRLDAAETIAELLMPEKVAKPAPDPKKEAAK